MKSKEIIIIVIAFLIVFGFFYFRDQEEVEKDKLITDEFIECLKREGVIIYGSSTCPACKALEEELGGYEIVEPIYLDCSMGSEEELERCKEEKYTRYVPEVQIKEELYKNINSAEDFAQKTNCKF